MFEIVQQTPSYWIIKQGDKFYMLEATCTSNLSIPELLFYEVDNKD